MKGLGILMLGGVLVGCAHNGGLENLGSTTLPDKRQLIGIQVATTMEGPQSVAAYLFVCKDGKTTEDERECELGAVQQANGPSLGQTAVTVFGGALGTVAGNVALAYPASKLKPDSTQVQQTGGGASSESVASPSIENSALSAPVTSSTSESLSGAQATAHSKSVAKQKQSQTQAQRQRQGQRQQQTQPAPMAPMVPMTPVD